jgi:hypothetical protein
VFYYEAERHFVNHTRGRKWAEGHLFFSPPPPPCSVASFVVNSELHTGARPSVRLCVGPELVRCVHLFVFIALMGFLFLVSIRLVAPQGT